MGAEWSCIALSCRCCVVRAWFPAEEASTTCSNEWWLCGSHSNANKTCPKLCYALQVIALWRWGLVTFEKDTGMIEGILTVYKHPWWKKTWDRQPPSPIWRIYQCASQPLTFTYFRWRTLKICASSLLTVFCHVCKLILLDRCMFWSIQNNFITLSTELNKC